MAVATCAGDQLEETAVAVVELDARADAGHEERRDLTRDAGGNRQDQRLTRRIRPWPPGHAREAAAEIVDDLSPAGGQRLGERPAGGVTGVEGNDEGANDSVDLATGGAHAGEPGRARLAVHEVNECERHVLRVTAERLGRDRARVLGGLRPGRVAPRSRNAALAAPGSPGW